MTSRRHHAAVGKGQGELKSPQLHAGNVQEVELLSALLVMILHRVGLLIGILRTMVRLGVPMQESVLFALGTMCR